MYQSKQENAYECYTHLPFGSIKHSSPSFPMTLFAITWVLKIAKACPTNKNFKCCLNYSQTGDVSLSGKKCKVMVDLPECGLEVAVCGVIFAVQ